MKDKENPVGKVEKTKRNCEPIKSLATIVQETPFQDLIARIS